MLFSFLTFFEQGYTIIMNYVSTLGFLSLHIYLLNRYFTVFFYLSKVGMVAINTFWTLVSSCCHTF
jgi:hypothetical protein